MWSKCRLATRRNLIAPRIITISNGYYSTIAKNGDGSGVDLYSDAPRTIRDFLTPSSVNLLDLTLNRYLPQSLQAVRHKSTELPPAYHFLFFPTSTSELDTLNDGYERHFAPRHPFKRRLWTQGRLEFRSPALCIGKWAECNEMVARVSQDDNGTDVWMERHMESSPADWGIRELRCLRYVKEIPSAPASVEDEAKWELTEADCILKHTFIPSKLLLVRYSFLTHNFHRIHIDSEYARTTEGYPDVLVQGSLSVTIILTTLSRFYISQRQPLTIKSAKYVMYRPLYVESPVTLTITETKSGRKKAILWNSQKQKAVECIVTHIL
jgi:3-methylfumaryl-CoA hydratase